jgi:hypothetical protein
MTFQAFTEREVVGFSRKPHVLGGESCHRDLVNHLETMFFYNQREISV